MPQHNTSHATRNTRRKASAPRRKQKRSQGTAARFLKNHMRLAWWIGGVAVALLYAWIFYYFFVSPTGFRWRALYGDANYPKGYEIHGIDISHYQGEINWDALRDAQIEGCPLRFVMIKATEGSSRLDENFKENFMQAREYGFIRGAYHFWSNKSSARSQATISLTRCGCRKATCRLCSTLNTNRQTRAWKTFSKTSSHGYTSLRTGIM